MAEAGVTMRGAPTDGDSAGPAFKPGDIVYLISGGPEMMVERVGEAGELHCVWFTTAGDTWQPPLRDRFVPATVQLVPRDGTDEADQP